MIASSHYGFGTIQIGDNNYLLHTTSKLTFINMDHTEAQAAVSALIDSTLSNTQQIISELIDRS